MPQLGFISNAAGEDISMLEKLNGVVRDLGFLEYTSTNKSMIDIFCITAALMFGTAGLPHVIIRFFTVRSAKAARVSAGWALLFIAVLYTTAPAVGAFARLNFIGTVNEATYVSGEDYAAEAQAIEAEGGTPIPQWFKSWEKTGLLSFEDKNGDGKMQVRGPHAPDGLENEVVANRDIFVLANPEIAQLPGWVIGLVVAGGLAAALSTAAGLLMVISSAISHDLCRRTLFKGMTDKTELRVARASAAGAVLAAGLLGLFASQLGFVAQVVAFAFGLAAASLFPIILLGIFWKRMNKEGAISSMLVGLISTFAYIYYFKFGGGVAADLTVMVMAFIGVFETTSHWLLYNSLVSALGFDSAMTNYLDRIGVIRAIASSGQPIVLGYLMAIAIGFYFFLQKGIKSTFYKRMGFLLLLAGLMAALSRGPWVGAVLIIIVFMATGRQAVKRLSILAVTGIIALPIIAALPGGEKIVNLIPFIGETEKFNITYRERLIDNSVIVIKRNLLLGICVSPRLCVS